jgi:hypothetical protein
MKTRVVRFRRPTSWPSPIRGTAGVKFDGQAPQLRGAPIWRYAARRGGDSVVTFADSDCGRSAEPIDLLARPERFELPTPWFVVRYSHFCSTLPVARESCFPGKTSVLRLRQVSLDSRGLGSHMAHTLVSGQRASRPTKRAALTAYGSIGGAIHGYTAA